MTSTGVIQLGARVERPVVPLSVPNQRMILPETGASSSIGEDCGLEVVVNLEKEQMERLRQNELFAKLAQ